MDMEREVREMDRKKAEEERCMDQDVCGDGQRDMEMERKRNNGKF